ncbi:enkurin-like [Oreochromis niloticus]|uniref:enkurin-like n=1 Tax=Oreochromis niloticus TaxID=8128 RepID=UPI000904FBC1|nr:enkurin-like [Oreochromis niloticus]
MSEFMFSEESAYNLLPKESNPPPKQKMYTSKYREAVVLENKQHKHKHRTMGPGTPKAPSHREMCPQRPEGEKPEHTCRKKTENTGIKKVMPQPACVDTRKGDKQLLEKSGLVPFYLKKKDYGNVPEYLQRRNAEKERADQEAWVKKQREENTINPLPEHERQKILQDLKRAFKELNFEYQSLPLVISPLQYTKFNYKKFLEESLSQLEKDIALFEADNDIYVGREATSEQEQKIQQQFQRTLLPPIEQKKPHLTPAPPVSQSTKKPTIRPFRMIQQPFQRTLLPPIEQKKPHLTPAPPVSQSTKKPTIRPFRMICGPPISRSGKQPIPTQPVIILRPSPVLPPIIHKNAEYTP